MWSFKETILCRCSHKTDERQLNANKKPWKSENNYSTELIKHNFWKISIRIQLYSDYKIQ